MRPDRFALVVSGMEKTIKELANLYLRALTSAIAELFAAVRTAVSARSYSAASIIKVIIGASPGELATQH